MATLDELTARESEASKLARDKLQRCISAGVQQHNEIISRVVEQVIVDKLVDPRAVHYLWQGDRLGVRFQKNEVDIGEFNSIHPHALGQMADVAGLTRIYLRRLYENDELWAHKLLVHNFDELFHNGDFTDRKGQRKRFLVRSVGKQIRGFLSQNYNRRLTTAKVLRAFIERCRAYNAGPVESTTTDVQIRLKYMLPFVFEPIGGEFVAFGAGFGNSDFGAGRLTITGTIMRINSSTTTVLDDKYSRTHLGSVIKDSDIEMSQETADKELEAVRGAISDAIKALLSAETIERNIRIIQKAYEKEIPWYKIKSRLTDLLGKEEIDMLDHILHGGSAVIDLPPVDLSSSDDGDSPNAWWTANAVSMFADKAEDPDKKAALQTLAGQFMAG